jgi:hypothetical protein
MEQYFKRVGSQIVKANDRAVVYGAKLREKCVEITFVSATFILCVV